MEERTDFTSASSLRIDILQRIIPKLYNLYAHGFSEPRVVQNEWSTSLILMRTRVALEIEIDWRDVKIFVLVVRLENGKLPSGYYVSEGRPCRYHLQTVISDRKWNVDRTALETVTKGKKMKSGRKDEAEDELLESFTAYKKVIDSCLEKFVAEEELLFSA